MAVNRCNRVRLSARSDHMGTAYSQRLYDFKSDERFILYHKDNSSFELRAFHSPIPDSCEKKIW